MIIPCLSLFIRQIKSHIIFNCHIVLFYMDIPCSDIANEHPCSYFFFDLPRYLIRLISGKEIADSKHMHLIFLIQIAQFTLKILFLFPWFCYFGDPWSAALLYTLDFKSQDF